MNDNTHNQTRQLKLLFVENLLFLYEFYQIPQLLQDVIYFFGNFQYITFLEIPIYQKQQRMWFSKFNYQEFIIYLSRFDVAFNFQFDFQEEEHIITLCFLFILVIFPIILLNIIKKKQKILEQSLFCEIFKISSIIVQIFLTYLNTPLSIFIITSVSHYNEHNEFLILGYNIFFIAFSVIIMLFLQFVLFSICLKTFNFKLNAFNQLNVTFLDYVYQILLLLQFITFCLVQNLKYGFIIQSIVIVIISIIRIGRTFEFHTCRKMQSRILLFISAFGLVLGMSNLIFLLLDDYQSYSNVITLLLFLMVNSVLQSEFTNKETSMLLKVAFEKDKSLIKYYLAKVINSQFMQTQLILINCLIYRKYNQNNLENVQNIQFETLNEGVQIKFFHQKIKQLCRIVMLEKELDIDYVSILYRLKFYNLSYKQIMIAKHYHSFKKQSISSEINKNEIEFRSINQPKSSNRSLSKSGKSNSEDLNNIVQKKVFKSNKLLISVREKITTILQAQLNFLKNQIRQEMLSQFSMLNNRKQKFQEIQFGIQLFLQNEKRNNNIRLKIIRLLQEKNIFYNQFVNKKILDHQKLFNSAKKISGLIYSVEQKLILRYERYPSHKVQSALIYFQAEIQNNFIEAYRLKNLTSISDQQLIEIDQNLQVQLFSKEIIHINVAQIEDQGDLIILSCSKNTQKFLQFSDQDFKNFSAISQILPSFIVDEHSILINKFIQTGESKFYLSYNPTFYKISQNLVKSCELLFDFHFDDIYTFKFSIFLQNASIVSAFMFVNINEQIGGFTELLFEKLKFNGQLLNILDEFDFKFVSITQLLPEYFKIIKEKKVNAQTEFRFIKQEILLKHFEKQDHIRSLVALWADTKNLNQFYVDISITYCKIWEFNYLLIEFKDIRIKQEQDYAYSLQVTKSRDEFDQAISLSSEAMANDAHFFTNNRLIFKIENLQSEEADQQIIEVKRVEPKLLYETNILSPNSSQIGLNELSLQQKMTQQQDYFNQNLVDNSCSLQRSIEQIKAQNVEKQEEQEELFEQQIKKNTTLTSKQTGIQKSQFYKKYELVQDSNFSRVPSSFGKIFLFILLSLGMSFIFYVIVLVLVTQDLNRFIAEIDMIQLHSGVMVPHDFYFQMRFTIFTYQGYLNKKVITQDRFNNLTDLLYQNMHIGYQEFKDGFLDQLNNQYLQVFYNDKNITVYYMYEFGLNTYPITYNVREVFFTLLTYYYQFLLRFQARLSPANQTYQVFQFANAYNLHFILEDLAQDAWQYSKDRSIIIKDKWNEIWMIFLIFSFIPILLSMYYLRIYKQIQDRYLNLFRYFSQIKVQREIEKNKQQIKLLKQNPDFIYYYKFDYELIEEQIIQEKNVIDKEQIKYKEQKYLPQFKQLSIVYFIIIIFGTWLIFFLFSFFNNQQIQGYLDKYPSTCDLYKFLQNMSLSAGSLSRNKEFKLTFPNLPYIRQDDIDKFYQTMDYSLNDTAEFLSLCLNFNPNLYHTSPGFMDYFNNIQGHDICSVLKEDDLGFLMYYCDISLSGNLRRGLLPTIKYLSNVIQLEQSINNFTKRVEYMFLEMEGGLIIIRTFQKMSKTFKEGMVTVTKEQIDTSNALSVSYVVLNILLFILYMLILPSMMLKELIFVKRFILIVPRTVLFLDDQIERHIRMIGANEKY